MAVVEVGVHGRSTAAAAAWTAWLTGCRCMEISATSTAGFDWGRSSSVLYMYPYGSMCNVTEKTMLQFYEVPQPMQLVPSTTMYYYVLFPSVNDD